MMQRSVLHNYASDRENSLVSGRGAGCQCLPMQKQTAVAGILLMDSLCTAQEAQQDI